MSEEKGKPGRPSAVQLDDALATYRDIAPTQAAYQTTVARMAASGFELLTSETLLGGSIRLHFRRKKTPVKGKQ